MISEGTICDLSKRCNMNPYGAAIRDVPGPLTTQGQITYRFTVEHDPIEINFGHCELRVYKGGSREREKNKINNICK